MRPPILFPLFAEVSTLKGVGQRTLPLVQKVAGPLVRDLVFLSPSGLIVRHSMKAATATEGEVGVFEVTIDRLFPPGRPGAPLKVRAGDDTGFVHLIWFGGSPQHIDRLLPRGERRLVSGKVERFNRTLLEEWAYACAYTSEADRRATYPEWLHHYNHHRGHTSLKGQ